MSNTDPIANLLTRIRNSSGAGHESVDMPAFEFGFHVAEVLKQEGYIRDVRRMDLGPQGMIRIFLKYEPDGTPVIRELKRVSKPGCRIYRKADEVPQILGGLGVAIVSTSKGVMTGRECRQRKLGGELVCSVS